MTGASERCKFYRYIRCSAGTFGRSPAPTFMRQTQATGNSTLTFLAHFRKPGHRPAGWLSFVLLFCLWLPATLLAQEESRDFKDVIKDWKKDTSRAQSPELQ